MTINADKLAQFDSLILNHGKHDSFDDGHCALEVVSWLADEGFTDAPQCASPVLARYVIRLNDRWGTEKRQSLKPYLIRMIGTGGDGKDAARVRIAMRHASELVGEWLDLAGLDATALRGAKTEQELRDAIYAARDSAWALRRKKVEEIKAEILKRLGSQPVAAAAADADAVADAAADAVADAAAAAAAAAVAAADAVADAAAAAAADAVADADAVAAAVADADADAVAGKNLGHWDTYDRVYAAVRKHYRTNPLPITEQAKTLAAKHNTQALTLLDALIDADEEFQS